MVVERNAPTNRLGEVIPSTSVRWEDSGQDYMRETFRNGVFCMYKGTGGELDCYYRGQYHSYYPTNKMVIASRIGLISKWSPEWQEDGNTYKRKSYLDGVVFVYRLNEFGDWKKIGEELPWLQPQS